MDATVVIDCFPESVEAYGRDYAIVAVDVIRATTTAVVAAAHGRRCYPVPSIEAAVPLAGRLDNPLLVGELGGNMPYGFHLNNSPADIAARGDTDRPMILLSTGGTRLICSAGESHVTYAACLRNYRAQAAYLAAHHARVAVIGAGSRGEFREEDQLGCAWIAHELVRYGFHPENGRTAAIIQRWRDVPADAIVDGASAAYLRRSGQTRDLEYILNHIDDLDTAYRLEQGQIRDVQGAAQHEPRSLPHSATCSPTSLS